ncbi:MAG: alpha-L-fucosidase [Kiritimatiellia bacterium]
MRWSSPPAPPTRRRLPSRPRPRKTVGRAPRPSGGRPLGLFIHWGLYSAQPKASWNGRTMPTRRRRRATVGTRSDPDAALEVPDADYRALAKNFNPVNFDAEALVQEAMRAGMKYIAITSKHHDGFALWDSAVSDFDLGATPCKRDLLGELAAACRKHGIKLGFYYSHWQDWEAPGGARPFWKPQPDDKAFEAYWKGKSLAQVAELIDRYDPDLFWFDTWNDEARATITPARRDELIRLIRTKSPRCLINGRIAAYDPGKDVDFLEMGDNAFPETWPGKPWQTPATMQHSWGWHAKDYSWKPSGQMVRLLAQCAALGGNYLLNIGPKFDGSLPAPTVRRLRELGGWMAANGESISGSARVGKAPWGWWTRSKDDGARYAHVFTWPAGGKVDLGPLERAPVSAALLDTAQPLPLSREGDHWIATGPASAPDAWDTVIVLRFAP